MRTMIKGNQKLEIHAHFMTKNMWEYFVYQMPTADNDNIGEALVMGFETEMGCYSKAEVAPYVICYTRELVKDDVMPAEGWTWADGEES